MTHVLVIEPDVVLADTISQYLADIGFEVDLAHNAQEAIVFSDEACPDVVILELALPNHNGAEFLQEFRSYSDWAQIPVIVYSHIPVEDTGLNQAEWRQHGVRHYLYKPANGLAQLGRALKTLNEAA